MKEVKPPSLSFLVLPPFFFNIQNTPYG
jgi:hypothetical protein